MKTVSIKVPEEMYQEMKELNLNWSEEIRKEIEDKIKKEKRRQKASKAQDFLKRKAKEGLSGADERLQAYKRGKEELSKEKEGK
jgi:hypothetical protein